MSAMEHYFNKCCVLLHLLLHCSCSRGLTNQSNIYSPQCTSEKFGANTPYQSNLVTLLSCLSSNATGSTEFYNTTAGIQKDPNNMVYGLFMCRGDVPHELCREWVSNATHRTTSLCPLAKQALIANTLCMVLYSNRNFFSHVEEEPKMFVYHADNFSDHPASFAWTLANTLNQVAGEAASCGPAGTKKFATREARVSERGQTTLHTLPQCTPDLSIKDCGRCLSDAIQNIAACCLERVGGRVTYPSCKIRYELYQFYWHVSPNPLRSSPGAPLFKGKRKTGSHTIVVIVVTATVSVVLLGFGAYFLRKRGKAVLIEKLLGDTATSTLGSLQFNFATIEAATNKFSPENKIGKGGFGEVYKVWKQWSEQTPLQILDSNIGDSYSEAEVTKCIQIGLLCVQEDANARPPMSTVVSYISSFSVKLPPPQEPAFYIHGKREPAVVDEEASPVAHAAANNSMPCSTNNITMTCDFPR